MRDPEHEEHEEYLTWIGGKFAPNAFDMELVNQGLRKINIAPNAWQMEDYPSYPEEKKARDPLPPVLGDEQHHAVEALPLRHDVLVLLNYLKANRVTGTPSSGNLTLQAVRAICARFVDPPELEIRIGKYVSRMRSESSVWPLYFVHVLASVGGLITGGPGRRWQVTAMGEKFMLAPAESQVWLLFLTWWTKVNWGIAASYAPDESPSARFRQNILEQLLNLPLQQSSPFDEFVDQVVQAARMRWPDGDDSRERSILQGLISSTVAKPLSSFAVLELVNGPHPTLGAEFPELHALTLTALGKSLLEGIVKQSVMK